MKKADGVQTVVFGDLNVLRPETKTINLKPVMWRPVGFSAVVFDALTLFFCLEIFFFLIYLEVLVPTSPPNFLDIPS